MITIRPNLFDYRELTKEDWSAFRALHVEHDAPHLGQSGADLERANQSQNTKKPHSAQTQSIPTLNPDAKSFMPSWFFMPPNWGTQVTAIVVAVLTAVVIAVLTRC